MTSCGGEEGGTMMLVGLASCIYRLDDEEEGEEVEEFEEELTEKGVAVLFLEERSYIVGNCL